MDTWRSSGLLHAGTPGRAVGFVSGVGVFWVQFLASSRFGIEEYYAAGEKLQRCTRSQVLVEYLIVFSVKVSMCRLAGP